MATSAQQVYEQVPDGDDGSGLPPIPDRPVITTPTSTTPVVTPVQHDGDTLPVTGFEGVLILVAALLACLVGWAFRMGGRR